VLAVVLGLVALPSLTFALERVRGDVELSTVLLVYLVVVLVIAGIGGRVIAVVTAVVASLLVNFYFVDPIHTFTITARDNVVALVVFVVVAAAVGWLVDIVGQRAREARRSRLQAEALARSAANLVTEIDPLPSMLAQMRATFELDGVRLRAADVDAPAEAVLDAGDTDGVPTLRLALTGPDHDPTGELEVFGRPLSDEEQRVLRVVADQLSVAVTTRRLAHRAADASTLAQVDEVRTAMLRSVSHDLRSPLASIKAMVTGLRDPDVNWSAAQLDDALATVEAETDRLDRLVGNLLDASRLQTGALATDARPTPVIEVVDAAVLAVGDVAAQVEVRLPDDLPLVHADPVLLERALANVLANACRFNPAAGPPVRIDAAAVGDGVHLRVVDHGPGITRDRRRQVLEPFQRLGDQRSGDGVGLGLTIAQGFAAAMGGRLELDDTAGGGLTVTIVLAPCTEVPPCRSS
jgi:two-component system sensor histidine kinase KdpD